MVAAFEASLANMTSRQQQLILTIEEKEREIQRLKSSLERRQSMDPKQNGDSQGDLEDEDEEERQITSSLLTLLMSLSNPSSPAHTNKDHREGISNGVN